MRKLIKMTGKRFYKWLVIGYAGRDLHNKPMWRCLCGCGKEGIISGGNLRNGHSKSCGCLKSKGGVARAGNSHPLNGIWRGMKSRCNSPNNKSYPRYGGRGIKVCERWGDILNFIKDMHPRTSLKHSIDRIDNDGDYTPENCRWATWEEQNRNSRSNVNITFGGKTMCRAEWSREVGISYKCLVYRLSRWPLKKAMTQKVRGWG